MFYHYTHSRYHDDKILLYIVGKEKKTENINRVTLF